MNTPKIVEICIGAICDAAMDRGFVMSGWEGGQITDAVLAALEAEGFVIVPISVLAPFAKIAENDEVRRAEYEATYNEKPFRLDDDEYYSVFYDDITMGHFRRLHNAMLSARPKEEK